MEMVIDEVTQRVVIVKAARPRPAHPVSASRTYPKTLILNKFIFYHKYK
jgi:hypothetical protein